MDVTLHSEFPSPDSAAQWNDLLAESITNSPFLRFEYLGQWWRTRGGGEWPEAELALIFAHEGERLVGIAPLFRVGSAPSVSSDPPPASPQKLSHLGVEGGPALLLLGSIEISDQLDLIVRPGELDGFLAKVLDYLEADYRGGWSALEWYNLPESSPTLPALQTVCAARGWDYQAEVYKPAPYIPLNGTYDSYLAGLDKKQRHELRRKVRRAEEWPGGVRWTIASDPSQLESEMESFLRLMAMDPAKASFLTPRMRDQMQGAARAAFREGWLQLAFLEVGGERACSYMNFDYGGRIWVYNSGFDPRFTQLSPGWVLLAYLLQWALGHGREEFDLLRGGEGYKYRLGGRDRNAMRVTVRRQ
jgi:CelD/BcsL family acetyltransferase involved in cellulose biosynthesis